jgi:hypothetical protein
MSLDRGPEHGGQPDPDFRFPPLPDETPRALARPTAVFAGCVMAWVGSVVGLAIGSVLITIDSGSPALDSVAPADRADVASSLAIWGTILVVACPIVIVAAWFAFRGVKWAALTLVGMAGAYLVAAVVSLASGTGSSGGLGLLWTMVSAGLLYANATARRWFDAMTAARRRA